MKTSLLLTVAGVLPIIAGAAVPREVSAEEECGELGVMEVPPGEDPSKYRRCNDHPVRLQKQDPETWTEADGPMRHDGREDYEVIVIEMEPSDDGYERPIPDWVWKKYAGPDGQGWYPPHPVRFEFVSPGEAKKEQNQDFVLGPMA
ncbi:hypothetical protein ACHAQA_002864 [Verticillium albo-atrum]